MFCSCLKAENNSVQLVNPLNSFYIPIPPIRLANSIFHKDPFVSTGNFLKISLTFLFLSVSCSYPDPSSFPGMLKPSIPTSCEGRAGSLCPRARRRSPKLEPAQHFPQITGCPQPSTALCRLGGVPDLVGGTSPWFSLYSEYVVLVLMDVLSSPSMIPSYPFATDAVVRALLEISLVNQMSEHKFQLLSEETDISIRKCNRCNSQITESCCLTYQHFPITYNEDAL